MPEVITPPVVTSTPTPKNAATVRQPDSVELATEFTVDPSLNVDSEITLQQPEKTVEQKKVVDVKVEPKVEVKPEIKVEPKKEDKKVEPPKPSFTAQPIAPANKTGEEKKRDYTGFSEQEVKVFGKMSNEAFDFVAPIIKEHKELGKLKTAQFTQHPDAYQLDPQYRQLSQDAYFYERELQHWQKQLTECVEGREWKPLTGWDDKGNPIYGAEQKPTTVHTELIRGAFFETQNKLNASRGNQQQFASRYQQMVAQDNQAIETELSNRLAWVNKPEMMEQQIEIPEVGPRKLSEIQEDFLKMIPGYQRNTLGFKVASHMWIALQVYGQKIRELENGKTVAEVKAEEATRAEPNSHEKPTENGKEINGVTEFTLPDFLKT